MDSTFLVIFQAQCQYTQKTLTFSHHFDLAFLAKKTSLQCYFQLRIFENLRIYLCVDGF